MTAGRQPAAAPGKGPARFVLVTGLSGSGKSHAIRALEDLGYFCVDNLPIPLIPIIADLSLRAGSEIQKVAMVVDVREGRFLDTFPRIYRELGAMPSLQPVLVFLEADDVVLVRRFSETRRPHPLARGASVRDGIHAERERMEPIRQLADEIVDTSDMSVHDLRRACMRLFGAGSTTSAKLAVSLMSFGFKYGLPPDADLVLDVRFLPNPHFERGLRRRTGRAPTVVAYLMSFPATKNFLKRTSSYLRFLIPQYVAEGKSYLTVAIGCTGGRHRSVMIAERLRSDLEDTTGITLRAVHRDLRRS